VIDSLTARFLSDQIQTIVRLEPRVRAGNDPEAVHKARVATRRFRAMLRAYRDVLPEDIDADARWFGRVLGEARDRDVQIETLRELARKDEELSPLVGVLVRERVTIQARVAEALDSPRFARMKALTFEAGSEPSEEWAQDVVRRAEAQLKKAEKLSADSPSTDFHRFRKRGKRLRYVLEALAPLLGESARKEIKGLKRLQDQAGKRQDDATTLETVQRVLHEPDLSSQAVRAGERLLDRFEKRERKHRRQVLESLG
jgi:CHAD domain-containing protein